MFEKENERKQKLKYNINHPLDVSASAKDAKTGVRPSTLAFLAIFCCLEYDPQKSRLLEPALGSPSQRILPTPGLPTFPCWEIWHPSKDPSFKSPPPPSESTPTAATPPSLTPHPPHDATPKPSSTAFSIQQFKPFHTSWHSALHATKERPLIYCSNCPHGVNLSEQYQRTRGHQLAWGDGDDHVHFAADIYP